LPGGGRKVTRVEVTLDGGETWQVCSLDHPERPTKYGKYWCWCFWSVDVEVLDVLGAKEIAVRAWDEAMNTQPEKLICNLMVSYRFIVLPFRWLRRRSVRCLSSTAVLD
jgi:nitrate reductase (NAD(P)H)